MKKTLFVLLVIFACVNISMTNKHSEKIFIENKATGNYYVYVKVSHPDGGNYSGAKVQGEVCGVLGGMTSATRTNNKGIAQLTFSSHESLCTIYINGKAREGRWSSGETAYFTD